MQNSKTNKLTKQNKFDCGISMTEDHAYVYRRALGFFRKLWRNQQATPAVAAIAAKEAERYERLLKEIEQREPVPVSEP